MTEPFRYLTLASSLCTEATYCFTPESPTSGDWVEELCQGVRQARFSTSRYFKLLLNVSGISNLISNLKICEKIYVFVFYFNTYNFSEKIN